MLITNTRGELEEALGAAGAQNGVPGGRAGVKFVPTMGALHEGHLSLVRAAKESGGVVVVSIFVNPTQFNDPADLRNYPRTPERDLEMLAGEGVDVVFMPSVEEMYPEPTTSREQSNSFELPRREGGRRSQPDTRVWDFGELDKVMEGATRPGHFNGVAQVVSRLFELVRPQQAFFGQKDFQQVAVIREMVRQAREAREAGEAGEGWADVEIVECPTVREKDGLALSSRNALLTPEHRAAAPDIYRALKLGAERPDEGSVVKEIERSGLLKVIYCNIIDNRILVAVQAGNVRLIDNHAY